MAARGGGNHLSKKYLLKKIQYYLDCPTKLYNLMNNIKVHSKLHYLGLSIQKYIC